VIVEKLAGVRANFPVALPSPARTLDLVGPAGGEPACGASCAGGPGAPGPGVCPHAGELRHAIKGVAGLRPWRGLDGLPPRTWFTPSQNLSLVRVRSQGEGW